MFEGIPYIALLHYHLKQSLGSTFSCKFKLFVVVYASRTINCSYYVLVLLNFAFIWFWVYCSCNSNLDLCYLCIRAHDMTGCEKIDIWCNASAQVRLSSNSSNWIFELHKRSDFAKSFENSMYVKLIWFDFDFEYSDGLETWLCNHLTALPFIVISDSGHKIWL